MRQAIEEGTFPGYAKTKLALVDRHEHAEES
jgi:hypothetical protein